MSRTSAEAVESLTTSHVLPRVNLLPPEVGEARKLRKLQTALGVGVGVVAVAIAGVYLLAAHDANTARKSLADVQAQTSTLEAQKAQYADVPRTISAIEAAETARQTAMANDVQWYRYLNDLSYVTPADTWLTAISVTVNGGTAAAAAAAPDASATLSTPGVATIAFSGIAKNHDDVAAWLNNIAKEKGWADPYFTSSSQALIGTTPTVSFNSTVTVTADALSHRFDRKDS